MRRRRDAGVGRVAAAQGEGKGVAAFRWAYFENRMQSLIYAVAFTGAKNRGALGRLAIRETKAGQRVDLLGDVADVQGVELDRVLLKAIRKKAEALSNKRNLRHTAFGHLPTTMDGSFVRRKAPGKKITRRGGEKTKH